MRNPLARVVQLSRHFHLLYLRGPVADRKRRADLTPEEREAIEARLERCPYCAGYHAFACPYVEEIDMDQQGRPLRVRFRREHRRLIRDILYLE